MKAPAWGPAQAAAYEEGRRKQAVHNAAPEMLELLRRYVRLDKSAGDTDNNLYRASKALIDKLIDKPGEPS